MDLFDKTLTENTRACYPLEFIANTSETGLANHPDNIVLLTADAFGVLPPISKLTPEQAMYHFLSGYTAKVAGTEKGLGSQPEATFSTCFGAPFMPRQDQQSMERCFVNGWLSIKARAGLLTRAGLGDLRVMVPNE